MQSVYAVALSAVAHFALCGAVGRSAAAANKLRKANVYGAQTAIYAVAHFALCGAVGCAAAAEQTNCAKRTSTAPISQSMPSPMSHASAEPLLGCGDRASQLRKADVYEVQTAIYAVAHFARLCGASRSRRSSKPTAQSELLRSPDRNLCLAPSHRPPWTRAATCESKACKRHGAFAAAALDARSDSAAFAFWERRYQSFRTGRTAAFRRAPAKTRAKLNSDASP